MLLISTYQNGLWIIIVLIVEIKSYIVKYSINNPGDYVQYEITLICHSILNNEFN